MLTSRPYSIKQNPFSHPDNDHYRRCENIGFLNEDIERFIEKYFQVDAIVPLEKYSRVFHLEKNISDTRLTSQDLQVCVEDNRVTVSYFHENTLSQQILTEEASKSIISQLPQKGEYTENPDVLKELTSKLTKPSNNLVSSKSASLKHLLKTHPHLKGIAHIPINLSFICMIWKEQSEKLMAASFRHLTLTTLYLGLIESLSARYLDKFVAGGRLDEKNYNHTACKELISFFKEISFKQMEKKELIISHQLFEEVLEKIMPGKEEERNAFRKNILNFGVLKPTDSNTNRRDYYFVHLTFQEFFAAWYIADNINEIAIQTLIKSHKYHTRYEIVWWFVSGLLNFLKKGLDTFFKLLEDNVTKDIAGLAHLCLMIRCIDESIDIVNEQIKNTCLESICDWIDSLIKNQTITCFPVLSAV